ncbi:Rossmann-fold NAD(P)-binding domain-containing protein [Streptomyces malaysiensis]|uniref:NADPH:quinone oxidoreductase 2 n=1 Tax=Streptomyces malaysiensis TaxID=92644 RepID=A0A7X5WYA0_STRMQ|nr:NADPH:quinone oxidoreductase 2 [Streptomyces malaysiensis]
MPHQDTSRAIDIGPALDGIEAVFLLGATSPAQTTHELNMLEAARAVGVRVVKLSVRRADDGLSPIARLHQPVEQSLVTSGLPWTILRPYFYLQNFLRQPSIREAGERRLVRDLGVKPLIAHRGTGHGSGLGIPRWAVDREGADVEAYPATGHEPALRRTFNGGTLHILGDASFTENLPPIRCRGGTGRSGSRPGPARRCRRPPRCCPRSGWSS